MPRRTLGPLALFALLLAPVTAVAGEIVIPIDGEVPAGDPDHFFIPFQVPAGIVEIEIRHDDLSEENILDWGLYDTEGFRGWGGGNAEPAVVAAGSASRSYLPGPITPGEWKVVVGKAQIKATPALYHVDVVLRDVATLAPQPERAPYAPAAPLEQGPRWYAGDFHVHSVESGDARPPLDEIADFARQRGLDFVEITDHNTVSQLDFFVDAQSRHPDLLFVPGVEYTTYDGHANGIGATVWVDHKIGFEGVTIEAAAQAFADQGAIFSINHPKLDLGDACIGCAWAHDLATEHIGAVEIATGGLSQSVGLFTYPAIAFWDQLCAEGRHVAAIGGSDDHRAGVDLGPFQSPIGDPTTMVFAEELSVAGILEAIRNGRTVVKLQGPDDPMIELSSSQAPAGDTVSARSTTLRAVVTGGAGAELRFVHNGAPQAPVAIDADPFTAEVRADAPGEGEDRWRAEVLVNGKARTVTSHVWLRTGPGGDTPEAEADAVASGGCGCAVPASAAGGAWMVAAAIAGAAGAAARRMTRRRGGAGGRRLPRGGAGP